MFSTTEASKLSGLSSGQLRYWDTSGLVQPSVKGTRGRSGVPRVYSFQDLVILRTFRELLDRGVSTQQIRKAWKYLHRHSSLPHQMEELRLFAEGGKIYGMGPEGFEPGSVFDALAEGQLVLIEMLGMVSREVIDEFAIYGFDRPVFLEALQLAEEDLTEQLASPPPLRRRAVG